MFGAISEEQNDPARKGFKIQKLIKIYQKTIKSIQKCKCPVICVIHGKCIGGAVSVISACDILIATEEASFSIREPAIGMACDMGALNILTLQTPNFSNLNELAFTARFFTADEALKIGLIGRISTNKTSALDHAFKIAKEITELSPVAIKGTKLGLNFIRRKLIREGLDFMAELNKSSLQTDDYKLSMISILNKTKSIYPRL